MRVFFFSATSAQSKRTTHELGMKHRTIGCTKASLFSTPTIMTEVHSTVITSIMNYVVSILLGNTIKQTGAAD